MPRRRKGDFDEDDIESLSLSLSLSRELNKYFLCGGDTTKYFARVFIPQTANENSLAKLMKSLFPRSFERKRRNRTKNGASR